MRFYNDSFYNRTPTAELPGIIQDHTDKCAEYKARHESGETFGGQYEYETFRAYWQQSGELRGIAERELAKRIASPGGWEREQELNARIRERYRSSV